MRMGLILPAGFVAYCVSYNGSLVIWFGGLQYPLKKGIALV